MEWLISVLKEHPTIGNEYYQIFKITHILEMAHTFIMKDMMEKDILVI